MKNLTKHTLTPLVIFSAVIFLFAISAIKVVAQTVPVCGSGLHCYNLGDSGEACHEPNPNKCVTGRNLDQYKCCDAPTAPTPTLKPTATPTTAPTATPIPTPTPIPFCSGECKYSCDAGETEVKGTACGTRFELCCLAPTATPTPTLTPIPTPSFHWVQIAACSTSISISYQPKDTFISSSCKNSDKSVVYYYADGNGGTYGVTQNCDSGRMCSYQANVNIYYCGLIPKSVDIGGACNTNTDCKSNNCSIVDDENGESSGTCVLSDSTQTPTNTPTPTPICRSASNCTNPPECHTSENACNNGACTYPVAAIDGAICRLNNGTQGHCSTGKCVKGAATVCDGIQGDIKYQCRQGGCAIGQTEAAQFACTTTGYFCCGTAQPTPTPTTAPRATNTPAPTATPTPTKAPTPTPFNNVSLALSLNAQDMPTPAISGLDVELALYNYANSTPEPDINKTAFFKRTSIEKKQYSITTPPANLNQAKYYIFARKDNMIARSVFTVSKPNETVSVPTATLVLGDIYKDDTINSLDYNALWNCWGKEIADSNPICKLSDLKNDNEIDEIDFNTLMKGWAIWKEEGKGL